MSILVKINLCGINFLKVREFWSIWIYGRTVLSYFFLNLGEGESGDNGDSDFEILLYFEVAIVVD